MELSVLGNDISGYYHIIHNWLEVHHLWLGPVIAVAAFLETLVVVGLLLPGVALLFALGALAGSGLLDIVPTYLWAFSGAALGDAVSYQLGLTYHDNVRRWWPFRNHQVWLEKGEAFIVRYGVMSVVFGRFIGPIRPVVPVVAGMLNMPAKRFYVANLLSSIPWAVLYLTPGFMAGAAIQFDVLKQVPEWGWWCFGALIFLLMVVGSSLKGIRKT